MGIRARDVLGRDFDGFLVVASRDAEQAGIACRRAGAADPSVFQARDRRNARAQGGAAARRLATPRDSAAIRHIGGLVPVED